MASVLVADTSVAVPLVSASHVAHDFVAAWVRDRPVVLCGHALAETYSVLTRLPGDARVDPADAVALIDENFVVTVGLSTSAAGSVHRELAERGISGGAVYDGLVAMAARELGASVVTRDARARSTYEALGVAVELIFDRTDVS